VTSPSVVFYPEIFVLVVLELLAFGLRVAMREHARWCLLLPCPSEKLGHSSDTAATVETRGGRVAV